MCLLRPPGGQTLREWLPSRYWKANHRTTMGFIEETNQWYDKLIYNSAGKVLVCDQMFIGDQRTALPSNISYSTPHELCTHTLFVVLCCDLNQIYPDSKFMWPTWGPPGSCWPQVSPMLAPQILLLGYFTHILQHSGWETSARPLANASANLVGRVENRTGRVEFCIGYIRDYPVRASAKNF